MSDDKLKPKVDTTITTEKRIPVFASKLHQRVAAAQASQQHNVVEAGTLPNRIGLALDVSGSMSGYDYHHDDKGSIVEDKYTKIELLRNASEAFITSCGSDTAVAVATFPESHVRIPMSAELTLAAVEVRSLATLGNTPMAQTLRELLNNEPMTRCVCVSDGEADNPDLAAETAKQYSEAGIQIDTVHIGSSERGEALLRSIAKTTGGLFIKFKDVTQFAQNFKYLTPSLRGLLASGAVDAKALGAEEIK